jgi:hypothetical protein
MAVTVEIKKHTSNSDASVRKSCLEAIENVLTTENLVFLKGISGKTDINSKLKAKHFIIKNFI